MGEERIEWGSWASGPYKARGFWTDSFWDKLHENIALYNMIFVSTEYFSIQC